MALEPGAELLALRSVARLGIEMRRAQALYFRARGRSAPDSGKRLEEARAAEGAFDVAVRNWLVKTGQDGKPDIEKPYELPGRLTGYQPKPPPDGEPEGQNPPHGQRGNIMPPRAQEALL